MHCILEKIENIRLLGLHRPYNKPLKSMVWVCTFLRRKHDIISPSNFYIYFYLNHLQNVVSKSSLYPNENDLDFDGLISPKTAKQMLNLFDRLGSVDAFQKKVSEVLDKRYNDEDRMLYRTYKNTSYYITLAKRMQLFDHKLELSPLGVSLSEGKTSFYKLSDREKRIIFYILINLEFGLFITLIISRKAQVIYEENEISIFKMFLENKGDTDSFKYVKSYDKNYVEVMNTWIKQLEILDKHKNIRKKYLDQIQENSFLKEQFDMLKKEFDIYLNTSFKGFYKKYCSYQLFYNEYKKLVAKGKSDLRFVNLYDIMHGLHKSYTKFSTLLNDYYFERKNKEIILFSNAVSSIDRRPRFVVNGKVVLKIKIINKKEYGNT